MYLTDDDKKGAMETVFPELMEIDKDDEIRQALIKYFTIWSKDASHTWGFKNEDIIDWLKRVKSVRVKSAKVTTGKLAEMIEQKALEDFKRINPWTFTVGLSHQEMTKKSEQDVPTNRTEEDERARKDLLNFLKSPFIKDNIADWKVAPWISWLEKQVSPQMVADAYLRGCNDTEKKWLESKRYTKMDVDNAWLEGIANAKREFEKQGKQEWTDEDESMLKDIIDYLQAMPIFFESVSSAKSGKEYTKKFIKDSVNWLKFIKERLS